VEHVPSCMLKEESEARWWGTVDGVEHVPSCIREKRATKIWGGTEGWTGVEHVLSCIRATRWCFAVDRAEPSPPTSEEEESDKVVGHGGQGGARPLLHTKVTRWVGHGGWGGARPLHTERRK
jgi:hypothetical protein